MASPRRAEDAIEALRTAEILMFYKVNEHLSAGGGVEYFFRTLSFVLNHVIFN
jgi:hypothetical protein